MAFPSFQILPTNHLKEFDNTQSKTNLGITLQDLASAFRSDREISSLWSEQTVFLFKEERKVRIG